MQELSKQLDQGDGDFLKKLVKGTVDQESAEMHENGKEVSERAKRQSPEEEEEDDDDRQISRSVKRIETRKVFFIHYSILWTDQFKISKNNYNTNKFPRPPAMFEIFPISTKFLLLLIM